MAVVVVVAIVLAATSGGAGRSARSIANTGSDTTSTKSSVVNPPSDAQVCADAWNREGSQMDKRTAAVIGSGGRAAAGYEASDPSSCLITFSDRSGNAYGLMVQFDQGPGGGVFVQGATGMTGQLPGDWVWNATANSDGTITVSDSATGDAGGGATSSNAGN